MSEEGEQGSTTASSSSVSNFFKLLSSYNSNVLLAALVFLLLVVLFVLLLHFYARFFWSNSDQEFLTARRRRRRRRNRRRTVTTTRIIPSVPLGGVDVGVSAVAATNDEKGLDSSVISSIPLFVYEDNEKDNEEEEEEECVICLGLWEVGDFGRKLRNCGHAFHVECIDMWLSSHSTCPLCRSPVLAVSDQENLKLAINEHVHGVEVEQEEEEAEVRLELFPTGEDENVVAGDHIYSLSLAVMEDNGKTGEGEVRIEVLEEEINGGVSRGERRSTSSASSSLMRMLSSRSRSECNNKVFPSATQDSSP